MNINLPRDDNGKKWSEENVDDSKPERAKKDACKGSVSYLSPSVVL